MNNRKELSVADIVSMSLIYTAIDTSISLCDGADDEYAEEMTEELTKMYKLLASAVTLKDGTSPKDWYYSYAECDFTFSFDEANDLADMIEDFKVKYEEIDTELSRPITEALASTQVEIAMDCLLSSLVEL